jgi:hypothetical protein
LKVFVAIRHPEMIENTAESSDRETNKYSNLLSEKFCLVKWQTNPNKFEKLTVQSTKFSLNLNPYRIPQIVPPVGVQYEVDMGCCN